MRLTAIITILWLLALSLPPWLSVNGTAGSPEIIEIAGAEWYYWRNPRSDTCLLWLGGGKAMPNSITINPYELEALNSIQYIQELGAYYSVIALKAGPYKFHRVYDQSDLQVELYETNSRFIEEAYVWIHAAGYRFAYAIGYSTGGTALGYEIAIRNPETWRAPDGVVIISAQLNQGLWFGGNLFTKLYVSALTASRIRSNLLLLYGYASGAALYSQGMEYYSRAPADGTDDGVWRSKQYMLLYGVGHEVWTREDDGRYDSTAAKITIHFVETARSSVIDTKTSQGCVLALLRDEAGVESCHLEETTAIMIESIDYSPAVHINDTVKVLVRLSGALNIGQYAVALYRLDDQRMVGSQILGNKTVTEIQMPVWITSSKQSFALFFLTQKDGDWVPTGHNIKKFDIRVLDNYSVSISTNAPGVEVLIDENHVQADASGLLILHLGPGPHSIGVDETFVESHGVRFVFTSWGDGYALPYRIINVQNSVSLSVSFKKQYFVRVETSRGSAAGEGWYDAGDQAQVYLSAIEATPEQDLQGSWVFFEGWYDGVQVRPTPAFLEVDSHLSLTARWAEASSFTHIIMLILAIATAGLPLYAVLDNRKRRG